MFRVRNLLSIGQHNKRANITMWHHFPYSRYARTIRYLLFNCTVGILLRKCRNTANSVSLFQGRKHVGVVIASQLLFFCAPRKLIRFSNEQIVRPYYFIPLWRIRLLLRSGGKSASSPWESSSTRKYWYGIIMSQLRVACQNGYAW